VANDRLDQTEAPTGPAWLGDIPMNREKNTVLAGGTVRAG